MYECMKCFSWFHTAQSFNRHVDIHPEHVNFECRVCKETFDTIFALFKHTRIGTSRPHACDKCLTSFNTPRALLEHQNSRHRNRVQCPNCEEYFPAKTFKAHFKKIHAFDVPRESDVLAIKQEPGSEESRQRAALEPQIYPHEHSDRCARVFTAARLTRLKQQMF